MGNDIYPSVDLPSSAVRELIVLALVVYCAQDQNHSLQVLLEVVPEWLKLLLGLSDLVDTYRRCPSDPQQAQYNVVAFVHGPFQQWRYTVMRDHVFGKLSAVLNVGRPPLLSEGYGKAHVRRFDGIFLRR